MDFCPLSSGIVSICCQNGSNQWANIGAIVLQQPRVVLRKSPAGDYKLSRSIQLVGTAILNLFGYDLNIPKNL